jgi:hypothetical protein
MLLSTHAVLRFRPIPCRLTYDEREAEERVFVEAITNQFESKEALAYAGGWTMISSLVASFVEMRSVGRRHKD